jgi:hypothetical protein
MKTETHQIGGKDTIYKVSDSGTYYSEKTPDELIRVLDSIRGTSQRVKIYLGDKDTGRDCMEEDGKVGKIGRSSGPIKIPILLRTMNSHGGGAILEDCIVKIVTSPASTGRVLYQHPRYHQPTMEITNEGLEGKPEYTHTVRIGGETYSRHTSERSAQRLVALLK